MQYALFQMNPDVKIMIDAHEMTIFNDVKAAEKVLDRIPEDDEMSFKVVYGAVFPQHGQTDSLSEKILASKGFGLGHWNTEKNECTMLELVDIRLYDPIDKIGRIPFAALIKTDLVIRTVKEQAISAFLRYDGMSPVNNVLNRFGIFAIKDQERRIKTELTPENWASSVDSARAIKAAWAVI